jgi:glycosyltransferase involved in cell wall biosynthesis
MTMIKSLSIVLPVFNTGELVIETLGSIERSLEYFYSNNACPEVKAEIIVVDDGSTDIITNQILKRVTSAKAKYILVENQLNLGIAASRNIGVGKSSGEIIFHCDSDDVYFEEHISTCYNALTSSSSILDSLSEWQARLHCYSADNFSNLDKEFQLFGFVKTKVKVRDSIHPYWQSVINYCHTLNLCVRRECHEFVNGLPEDIVYRELRQDEDTVYNQKLLHFFRPYYIDRETVEYFRYHGNCLDRQMDKFRLDPKNNTEKLSQRDSELRALAANSHIEKLSDLEAKFNAILQSSKNSSS